MNKVQLVGRICADVEYRTTQNGTAVANFRVAVQRRFKNANGVYESDFISCQAWRNTAEFVNKYFAKGSMIGVVGSIQTRSYDAQDGSKRYVTEVIVDEAEFVGSKKEQSAGASEARTDGGNEGYTEIEDDGELPF